MATFEDYLKFEVSEAEEDKKQLRIMEKISLSNETEKAIKAGDKVSEDMFTGMLAGYEKTVWMLKAYSK